MGAPARRPGDGGLTSAAGRGQPRTIVVALPAEVGYSNGQEVLEQLLAAFGPAIETVVVDMVSTTFCDSAGLARIAVAHRVAVARNATLRVAVPAGIVTKIFEITGLDTIVPLYPSLAAALAADGDQADP